MWGVWILLITGGIGVVLLAIALMVGLSPLLAVALFAVAFPVLLLLLRRESGEPGSEPQGAEKRGGKPSWMTKHWYE
jgi:membrane protein implicated in regulation of membrane protease activity